MGASLKVIGIVKDVAQLTQRTDERIPHAFNSLDDYVAGKTIGNDDVCLSTGYILAFDITDEVQTARFQKAVGLL